MLSKEIMKRTILRNKFTKKKSDYARENYLKQRNYCESMLRKTIKDYCQNLSPKKNNGQ